MKGDEFVYFSMRNKKQREMVELAIPKKAERVHLRLVKAYADLAAKAMLAES